MTNSDIQRPIMHTKDPQSDTELSRRAVWLVATRGVSSFGSAMTAFGLDVSIFQRTGSYQTFALLAILTYLPNIVLGPFTGGLVDRLNKKHVLLGCEIASMGAAAFALWQNSIGAFDAVSAAFVVLTLSISSHVRWTAMSVAISMLVPKSQLQRINGLQQGFQGVTDTTAPIAGALAFQLLGFSGMVWFDLASYVCAIGSLVMLPAAAFATSKSVAKLSQGLWGDAALGFRWIRNDSRLFGLLIFISCYNFVGAIFTVSFTPYVLSLGSPQLLGVALALDGTAAIAMGFALARWKGRTYPFGQVTGAALVFGTAMVIWGWVRNPAGVCFLSFLAGSISTLLVASLQTIWQSGVPVEVQGRVFAIRRMVSYLLIPISILVSIPFAERVLLPIVDAGGMPAQVWGEGQAGALGMMLSVAGFALSIGCVLYIRRSLVSKQSLIANASAYGQE